MAYCKIVHQDPVLSEKIHNAMGMINLIPGFEHFHNVSGKKFIETFVCPDEKMSAVSEVLSSQTGGTEFNYKPCRQSRAVDRLEAYAFICNTRGWAKANAC